MNNSRENKDTLFWYYKIAGGHTHVRVFMNGGKAGDLCFRNEEFEIIRGKFKEIVFVPENYAIDEVVGENNGFEN